MDAVQPTQVGINKKTYTLTVGDKPINFEEVIKSITDSKVEIIWPGNKKMTAKQVAGVIIDKLLKKNIGKEKEGNITISADNFNDFIFDNFNEDNLHYIESIGYKIAADNGYAKAQCNYGFCLKNGKGVKQNLEEAARYYLTAAILDPDDSKNNFKILLTNNSNISLTIDGTTYNASNINSELDNVINKIKGQLPENFKAENDKGKVETINNKVLNGVDPVIELKNGDKVIIGAGKGTQDFNTFLTNLQQFFTKKKEINEENAESILETILNFSYLIPEVNINDEKNYRQYCKQYIELFNQALDNFLKNAEIKGKHKNKIINDTIKNIRDKIYNTLDQDGKNINLKNQLDYITNNIFNPYIKKNKKQQKKIKNFIALKQQIEKLTQKDIGENAKSTIIESLQNNNHIDFTFAFPILKNKFNFVNSKENYFKNNNGYTFACFNPDNVMPDDYKIAIKNKKNLHYTACILNDKNEVVYELDSLSINTQNNNCCLIHAIENALILKNIAKCYKDKKITELPIEKFTAQVIEQAKQTEIEGKKLFQQVDSDKLKEQRDLLLKISLLDSLVDVDNSEEGPKKELNKAISDFMDHCENYNRFNKNQQKVFDKISKEDKENKDTKEYLNKEGEDETKSSSSDDNEEEDQNQEQQQNKEEKEKNNEEGIINLEISEPTAQLNINEKVENNINIFDLIKTGSIEDIKTTIDSDLNLLLSKNKYGETPLIYALIRKIDDNKAKEIVKSILNILKKDENKELAKKVINTTDNSGKTTLSYAITTKNAFWDYNTVKLLLEAGADPAQPNADGYIPITIAYNIGRYDVVELLQKEYGQQLPPLQQLFRRQAEYYTQQQQFFRQSPQTYQEQNTDDLPNNGAKYQYQPKPTLEETDSQAQDQQNLEPSKNNTKKTSGEQNPILPNPTPAKNDENYQDMPKSATLVRNSGWLDDGMVQVATAMIKSVVKPLRRTFPFVGSASMAFGVNFRNKKVIKCINQMIKDAENGVEIDNDRIEAEEKKFISNKKKNAIRLAGIYINFLGPTVLNNIIQNEKHGDTAKALEEITKALCIQSILEKYKNGNRKSDATYAIVKKVFNVLINNKELIKHFKIHMLEQVKNNNCKKLKMINNRDNKLSALEKAQNLESECSSHIENRDEKLEQFENEIENKNQEFEEHKKQLKARQKNLEQMQEELEENTLDNASEMVY